MLDETEFLSPYGVRALSRSTTRPSLRVRHRRRAATASTTSPANPTAGLFGGNSNWRGPIWMPVNFLLIESLHKFHHYYGDDFKVECPTGSGAHADARRGRRRAVAAASSASSCATPTAGGPCFGEPRQAAERPALPRPRAVPRVLPRRHRPRRRRVAPDRLDRRSSPSCISHLPDGRSRPGRGDQKPCSRLPELSNDRTESPMYLKDKVAIVTGGNSGIGKAIALGLAAAGRQHRHRLRRQPRGHRGRSNSRSSRSATRPSASTPTSARSPTCRR